MAAIESPQSHSAKHADTGKITAQHDADHEKPEGSMAKPQGAPTESATLVAGGEDGDNTTGVADQAAESRDTRTGTHTDSGTGTGTGTGTHELIAATRIAAFIRGKLARRRVTSPYNMHGISLCRICMQISMDTLNTTRFQLIRKEKLDPPRNSRESQ